MRFLVLFLHACLFFITSYAQSNFDFTRDTFEYNKTYQLQLDKVYSYQGNIDFDKLYFNKLLYSTSNPSAFPYHSVFDNQIIFVQNNTLNSNCNANGGNDFIRIPVSRNLQINTGLIEHIGLKNFSDSTFFADGQALYNHAALEIGYLSERVAANTYKHYDVKDVNVEGCNTNQKLHITSKKIKQQFTYNGVPSFTFKDSLLDVSLYDDSNIIYDISTLANGNKVKLKFLNLSKNATVEVYNPAGQLLSRKILLPTLSNPDSNYIFENVSLKNDSVVLLYFKAPNDSVHRLKVFNTTGSELYNYTYPITNLVPASVRFNELNNENALISTDSMSADSTKKLYYLVQKDKPTRPFYIPVSFYEVVTSITRLPSKEFVLLSENGRFNKSLSLIDTAGNIRKKVPVKVISDAAQKFAELANESYGKIASDSSGNLFLLAPKDEYLAAASLAYSYLYITPFPNNISSIEGNVIVDVNKNCIPDTGEKGLENWLVELKQHNVSSYALTSADGYFSFRTDTGAYQLILHNRNTLLFDSICTPVINGNIAANQIYTDSATFLVKPTICYAPPKLDITVHTTRLVKCRTATYTVTVKNEGQGYQVNPYVDIVIDTLLDFESTTHVNYTALSPKKYRFYLDTLYGNNTYTFYFNVLVNCDALNGRTHCVDAKVYPKLNCKTNTASYLTSSAKCLGDSVVFSIKNESSVATVANKKYLILENDSIIQQNTYQLGGNQSKTIGLKNRNASTFRLITYQDPATPIELADSVLTAVIEGCTNAENYSTGYVTNVVPSDNVADEDIDCQPNLASFDPNDKLASPVGFSESHFIEKNQAITYTLRFQNTGTYYAFDVVLIDSLSSNLDISTLKYIGASHQYVASIRNNILKVTFSNILLPWKSLNEEKSNGFFSFRITPKASLIDGDKIYNNANIYFDFNAPVLTNTTFHTIGRDFIKVKVISGIKNNWTQLKTSVFPNPFSESATLSFEYPYPTRLTILSVEGKILQQYEAASNSYTIERKNLSKGLCLYELRDASTDALLDTGKIIAE